MIKIEDSTIIHLWYNSDMSPAHIYLEGDDDSMVLLQVQIPLWLKKRAAERAQAELQTLSTWVRGVLLAALGTDTPPAPAKPRRKR